MIALKNGIQAHEYCVLIVPQMRHIVTLPNILV